MPPPMQSDESSRDFLDQSGENQVSSGDGSEGRDDEDSDVESGSSSGTEPEGNRIYSTLFCRYLLKKCSQGFLITFNVKTFHW